MQVPLLKVILTDLQPVMHHSPKDSKRAKFDRTAQSYAATTGTSHFENVQHALSPLHLVLVAAGIARGVCKLKVHVLYAFPILIHDVTAVYEVVDALPLIAQFHTLPQYLCTELSESAWGLCSQVSTHSLNNRTATKGYAQDLPAVNKHSADHLCTRRAGSNISGGTQQHVEPSMKQTHTCRAVVCKQGSGMRFHFMQECTVP